MRLPTSVELSASAEDPGHEAMPVPGGNLWRACTDDQRTFHRRDENNLGLHVPLENYHSLEAAEEETRAREIEAMCYGRGRLEPPRASAVDPGEDALIAPNGTLRRAGAGDQRTFHRRDENNLGLHVPLGNYYSLEAAEEETRAREIEAMCCGRSR